MLRPVGSLPPRVYWRRRVVVLGVLFAVVFLFAITVHALGSDGTKAAASASGAPSSGATRSSGPSSPASSSPASSAASSAATSGSASTAAILPCTVGQLKIVAATDKPTYTINQQPIVALQVTNTGPAPCSEALGDAQIEFRIYNGAARVWGSHDCKIDQTPDVETLPVNSTVAKTVTWSGYSSEVNCGVRQRVGAGTYTLSAYLAGTVGATAQFAITG